MTTLHLVFSPRGWQSCKARMAEGDAVVLLGDGVYVTDRAPTSSTAVLGEDLQIRGVSTPAGTSMIDYPALVDLCTRHTPVVSWQD